MTTYNVYVVPGKPTKVILDTSSEAPENTVHIGMIDTTDMQPFEAEGELRRMLSLVRPDRISAFPPGSELHPDNMEIVT